MDHGTKKSRRDAVFVMGSIPCFESGVSKPDRYEPTFTQLCEQLGVHYQIELQAARVGKPKDKASVENAVSQVYRSVYAPLRNEVFFSLQALNEAIIKQLEVLNERSYQKKEGSRKSLFEAYELPVMRPLPSDTFEIKKITRAKVQRNYHIFFSGSEHLLAAASKHPYYRRLRLREILPRLCHRASGLPVGLSYPLLQPQPAQ